MIGVLLSLSMQLVDATKKDNDNDDDNDKKEDYEIRWDNDEKYGCMPKESEYISHGNQITINKEYKMTLDELGYGMGLKLPCEHWREQVQNYTAMGYSIIFEGDTMITMQAPN